MSTPACISIPGGQGFIACVLVGDREKPQRVWVCVHNALLPRTRAWLGSWSSEATPSSALVRGLVGRLAGEIAAKARVGPMGPFLGDTYFFEGWQTWGIGLPAPLVDLAPAEVMEQSGDAVLPDEYSLDTA
jgi:hypothetical protein